MIEQRHHRPEDLSDQQINHIRRFAGLPPLDATGVKTLRGFLRWMKERLARRRSNDKRPRS